jgi:hypothetical protein
MSTRDNFCDVLDILLTQAQCFSLCKTSEAIASEVFYGNGNPIGEKLN